MCGGMLTDSLTLPLQHSPPRGRLLQLLASSCLSCVLGPKGSADSNESWYVFAGTLCVCLEDWGALDLH
jgi:hypothetical protein